MNSLNAPSALGDRKTDTSVQSASAAISPPTIAVPRGKPARESTPNPRPTTIPQKTAMASVARLGSAWPPPSYATQMTAAATMTVNRWSDALQPRVSFAAGTAEGYSAGRMAMPLRLTFHRLTVTTLTVVAGSLWLAAPQVKAQEPVTTEPPSAVAQYVEAVITGSAPSVPGTKNEPLSGLSPASRRALKQTSPSTAAALERVATSSTYGAPQGSRQLEGESVAPPSADSLGSALQATADSTTSDPRLLGLLLVVVATTAGTVALAVRRLRLASPPPY